MIQKFLVQIEDVERTRWVVGPEQVRECLAALAHRIADAATDGPRPHITVIRDEIPETEAYCGHNT